MKKLLLLFLLLAASALLAQNARKDDVVFTRIGSPAPGALIAVCTQPCTVPTAVSLSNLPSPLAAICASSSDAVCIQTNPVTADGLGNYSFYIAPGKYTLVFFGSGLTQRTQTDQVFACDPSATCTIAGQVTFNAAPFFKVAPVWNTDGTLDLGSSGVRVRNIFLSGTIQTSNATMGLTLKKGSGGGNYSSASTTYVRADSTNLAFTVTIPTGWKLSIQASGTSNTATAAVLHNIALADGSADNTGILVETQSLTPSPGGGVLPFSLSWVITGDGNSHTINLQYKTSNGADSVVIENSSATKLPTMVFTLLPSN